MKKSLVITGLTLATIGAVGSTTLALASDARGPDEQGNLSTKIAAAFNLEPSAVQKVIDQYRNDQQSSRLQIMVDNGRLTAEQKTLVENKLAEIQPRLDTINALTDQTARHEAMSQLRTDMQQWEKDNNVQLPRMLGRMHDGERGMMHNS